MNRLIAIPMAEDLACAHFGQCDHFALFETAGDAVVSEQRVTAPVHRSGAYPGFLAGLGVNLVLAGGMGAKARELFSSRGIAVHLGVAEEPPRVLVERFLAGEPVGGVNACNHGGGDHDHDHDHGRCRSHS